MFGFVKSSCESLDHFWRCCPALLYGLATLLGFSIAFQSNYGLIFPVLLLWLPITIAKSALKKRLLCGLLFFFGAMAYGHALYTFPQLEKGEVWGKGTFVIDNISSSLAFGKKTWTYQGTLKHFSNKDGTVECRNIPCSAKWTEKGKNKWKPPAHSSYELEGLLKEVGSNYYTLKVPEQEQWRPLTTSFSLVELRHKIKSTIRSHIVTSIPHRLSGTFLAGLITGEFNDPYLSFEFSRFGLQHIMAISGFHFAIIALLLNALLRFVLPLNVTQFFLLFLLGGYFLLLGPRPSIVRAWLMITVGLCGYFSERSAISLNSLGVAILAVLFIHPLHCLHLGFQFSFGITATILLFTKPLHDGLKIILPFRSNHHVFKMPMPDQHGILILSLFRQALALTIAVNLFAIPFVLYTFHKFPMISLLYNLFFPFLVSISMLLLALSYATISIPPLSQLLFLATSSFTNSLINITYHLPLSADYHWRIDAIPTPFLIGFFSLLFFLGIRVFSAKATADRLVYL